MSSATYIQQNTFVDGDAVAWRPTQPKPELHSVDLATWNDGNWADPYFSASNPVDIDEPWPYRFTSGQSVWICASNGEWYPGRIVGRPKKGKTRVDDGLFWWVEFIMGGCRVRKWFAPLNGEIKPDIEHTHLLLSEAGWLESGSDE